MKSLVAGGVTKGHMECSMSVDLVLGGGAAAPLLEKRRPLIAHMAGSFAASANPHDCQDDRIPSAISNAIRGLT
jgi:hypothetical protein